jgi:hypothetical protein
MRAALAGAGTLTSARADLLSFLDRSNIGNAKVEGIERDIRITNYPLVVTMFFIVRRRGIRAAPCR